MDNTPKGGTPTSNPAFRQDMRMIGEFSRWVPNKDKEPDAKEVKKQHFYQRVWRWHFYSGIYVVPFMIMLSLTGIVMLFDTEIKEWRHPHLMTVEVPANPQPVSMEQQITAIKTKFPEHTIHRIFIRDRSDNPSTSQEFIIQQKVDGKNVRTLAYVNPYDGKVLGSMLQSDTWYAIADNMHGTFLIGDVGDRLIEIAAGLGFLLIITGFYLWWPGRGRPLSGVLWPSISKGTKTFVKEFHVSTGVWMSAGLVFFLLSGMAWTGVWGGKIVQPWSSFPVTKTASKVPLSDVTHGEAFNSKGVKGTPWGLEQAKMPASGSSAGEGQFVPAGTKVTLDSILASTSTQGFGPDVTVSLPDGKTGVYTIATTTMGGDTGDPRLDRTVHVDQYTGKILADVGYDDYSVMAKAMAIGIGFHMGKGSTINFYLNLIFCLLMVGLSVTGVMMWWYRRPANAGARVVAPPMPSIEFVWRNAVFIALLVAIAFPMVGLVFGTVYLVDKFLVSNVPALNRMLS